MATIQSPRLAARIKGVAWAPDPIALYLDRLRLRNCSEHTLRNYRAELVQAQAAIAKPLTEATARDLDRYMAREGKRGLKAGTVKKKQTVLRSFFKWALRYGHAAADPTIHFDPPKDEHRLAIHLEPGEVAALLTACDGGTPHDRRAMAIVACLYYAGMRACEVVNLNCEDLRFGEVAELRVFGKGKKERLIPACAALRSAIEAWLDCHPTRTGPVFVRIGSGRRLTYDSVYKIVRSALQRAGLTGRKFSPHKLRHSFATRLVRNNVPIERIQKLLGHASIATTQIYAHSNIDQGTRDAMERIL